jgi:hypothetical protein
MKRRQLISHPLLVLSLTLTSTVLASNTWYVDGVNGSDANDCQTALSACKTIGHAISVASPGDSIIVAAATYTENLTIGSSLNVIGSGANTTIIDGGAVNRVVNISGGTVTLAGLTLRNGAVAYGYGGVGAGILNGGTLFVTASTITENSITVICPVHSTCHAAGGGIYNSTGAKLTISNSTIAANTVLANCHFSPCSITILDGGGIYNAGSLVMTNSTIAQNAVQHTFGFFGLPTGGGISNRGPAIISNSTISGNSAAANRGGDIWNYPGNWQLTLQNSIVANSSSGGNCNGAITSNGYNLSSDNTCNFGGRGDLNNTDPKLGTVGYNGGPTQTIPLLSGSPAIDAGNPSGCTGGQGNLLTTDQRGMPRPDPGDTGGCDMGAYESQSN